MDAAGQVAQLLEGELHLAVRLVDHPRGGLRVLEQLLLRQPQVHGEGDEPGLRAVVQVALDAAQVGGGGVHHDPRSDSSSDTRVASRDGPSSPATITRSTGPARGSATA